MSDDLPTREQLVAVFDRIMLEGYESFHADTEAIMQRLNNTNLAGFVAAQADIETKTKPEKLIFALSVFVAGIMVGVRAKSTPLDSAVEEEKVN